LIYFQASIHSDAIYTGDKHKLLIGEAVYKYVLHSCTKRISL